ncbi:hypothetical protein K2173_026592 [Erythroxylum novogranatense]|uniref:Two-component response regulator n=1 Tax=Erythroxylum novogranatense TaxID=1862640 RepID=A0AAV8TWS0_9ROSI|nr:hypothetical protein K2173_026592 [Erythroxylum novogranatense]
MGRERSVPTPSLKTTSSLLKIQILVVDDDSTSLAIVASMLKTYCPRGIYIYRLLTVRSPLDALLQLRLHQGFFDLVVTDLYMPVMNGIELQQQVNEEFNLPVVIMSSDDKKSVVMDCLESGASFYMMKPVNQNDLKNIWQCAVTSKQGKPSAIMEGIPSSGEKLPIEYINSSASVPQERRDVKGSTKKLKRKGNREDEDGTTTGPKKAKVVWTNSLHNRFLHAISHLGLDKSVPKKILEFMSVPGLTRENVASHLQKYRIFLKRVAEKGNSTIPKDSSEKDLRSTFANGLASMMLRSLEQQKQQRLPEFVSMQKMGAQIQPGRGETVSLSPDSPNFTSLNFPNHHQLPLPLDQQQIQTLPSPDKICNIPTASGIEDGVVAVNNSSPYLNNGQDNYVKTEMIGDGLGQKNFNAGDMLSGINGFINWNCNDFSSSVPSMGNGSFSNLVQTGSAIPEQFSASLTGANPESSSILPIAENQDGIGNGPEDMDFFNLISDGSTLDDILNYLQLNSDFDEILSHTKSPYQQQAAQVFRNSNFSASNSNQPKVSFSASNSYQAQVNNTPSSGLSDPNSYQQVQGGGGMNFNGNENLVDAYQPSFIQDPETILDPNLDGMYSADNATEGIQIQACGLAIQDWNDEFFNSLFDDDIF